jgi:hypothetical protein
MINQQARHNGGFNNNFDGIQQEHDDSYLNYGDFEARQ